MKKLAVALLPLSVLFAGAVQADVELAKSKGCLGCHQLDKKVMGPAWNDVGAKYAAEADGKATILASIKGGSKGKWGGMAMPPQGALSDADAETLASFIISLGK